MNTNNNYIKNYESFNDEYDVNNILNDIMDILIGININDFKLIIGNPTGCPINLRALIEVMRDLVSNLMLMLATPPSLYLFLKTLSFSAETLFEHITETLDTVINKYKNKLQQIRAAYRDFNIYEYVETTVSKEIDSFIKKIEEKLHKIANFENYMTELKSLIINELNNFKNKLNDEKDKFYEKFISIFEPIDKLFKDISNFIENFQERFKELFLEKLDKIFEPIKSIYLFIIKNSSYIFTTIYILSILILFIPAIMQIYNKNKI